jgi:hypothetical protein
LCSQETAPSPDIGLINPIHDFMLNFYNTHSIHTCGSYVIFFFQFSYENSVCIYELWQVKEKIRV